MHRTHRRRLALVGVGLLMVGAWSAGIAVWMLQPAIPGDGPRHAHARRRGASRPDSSNCSREDRRRGISQPNRDGVIARRAVPRVQRGARRSAAAVPARTGPARGDADRRHRGRGQPVLLARWHMAGILRPGRIEESVPQRRRASIRICQTGSVFGASWGSNDTIVFARDSRAASWRVSASGGPSPQADHARPGERGELSHRLPHHPPRKSVCSVHRDACAVSEVGRDTGLGPIARHGPDAKWSSSTAAPTRGTSPQAIWCTLVPVS